MVDGQETVTDLNDLPVSEPTVFRAELDWANGVLLRVLGQEVYHSTNVPTGLSFSSPMARIRKLGGTATRVMQVDYLGHWGFR